MLFRSFGVPLMIRLQVRSMEKIPPFEFDKIETEIPVYSWNPYSRNTRIVNIKLFPGIYRVKVENLLAAPDFAGRKINFQIYKAYFGK